MGEMDPTHLWGRLFLASAYYKTGKMQEGLAILDPLATSDDPSTMMTVGSGHAVAGRMREARAMLDRLTALSKTTYVLPSQFAFLQMRVGLIDEAFRSLDRMLEERSVGVIGLKLEPVYDPVRNDPRFATLLKRAGFGS